MKLNPDNENKPAILVEAICWTILLFFITTIVYAALFTAVNIIKS